MILRRASRFGSKIGLNRPVRAEVSELVVRDYGKAFPELEKNRKTILENITREEKRFHKTVEVGMERLDELFQSLPDGKKILDGHDVFEMYATHGLPLEITRDMPVNMGLTWMWQVLPKQWKITVSALGLARRLERWAARMWSSTARCSNPEGSRQIDRCGRPL